MVKKRKKDINDLFNEPLAIIGMNCLLPGLDSNIEDVDALYDLLIQGKTPIKEVPKDRWDMDQYYDADRRKADKIISRLGGFLNDIHLFDADYFKISPTEAKQIDPQHRLFLEVSIRALNHANVTHESLNGSKTGVYCGISSQDYSHLNYKDNILFNAYTQIGAATSAASGRLSHFLNLKGPSMAVDTACSSSLSALYLAATHLKARQCDTAIVGGVHLNICPENLIGLTKANMLSARGRCSSFDNNADGFVRSEGCAVVVVKRLNDAIKDNDRIHAVIKSIVMNQDGNEGSLVAPNINAQIAMHEAVLEQAQLKAGDIDYIETHGTGTRMGDSVEFNAIQHIHQGHHSKEKPLILGALKSNIGHTISSSGIASLIKVMGALKNESIPPNLHYSMPSESIHPETIPALLPVQAIPFLKQHNKKRYAQISNFGFSGTNVSLIVEEPPLYESPPPRPENNKANCFVLSASNADALKQMLATFLPYLKKSTSSLSDICYTLINCRDHHKFRCALIANDKEALIKKIELEDYEFKKVSIDKEKSLVVNDAQQIWEHYLSGANVRLDCNKINFDKIDLPLYSFDRKPYWHEPRKPASVVRQPSINVLNIEPIAIIGMSCRLPKAPNIDAFLSLLEQGESGMTDIPLERWDNAQYYDADVNALGRLCIKQLGLIDNIKNFDADFFNISPREAKLMSPMLRVFMETCYHALEDANLSLDTIKDSNTGVFVGVGPNEYRNVLINQGLSLEDLNIYFATGNALNAIAGRVAYTFDFHGPIQVIDTACSSSMTAIHNACLSLQSGDCDMAIAGGINTLLVPESNIILSKARMLSPESRCKTFSEDADGYARSEGCGIIVLKRLSTAIEDKDNILAVIKGSAINSDGKGAGFTVPNGTAQEEVIRRALAKSKLLPSDIDYIEAHGTGTPLADPIEVNTLTKIFSNSHSNDKPLYISSVKTNIGHCESASGVSGLIKAVLSLKTHQLFKHLNFKKLNPNIELKNTVIPLTTMVWQKDQDLRCAGVSSFGFSGANAHVIVQEAPERKKEARTLPQRSLLTVSARSKRALELLLVSYQKYLSNTHDEFADICFTAATCRKHFLFRVAIQANSGKEAAAMIEKNEYRIFHITKEQASNQKPLTLEQVQAAYQDGITIDWVDFYTSLTMTFEKVKLPLYEFDRKEYWPEFKDKLKEVPIPKNWCFQLQWQHQGSDKNNSKIHGNDWLLLGAKHLITDFKAQGLNILLEDDDYTLEKMSGIIFAVGIDVKTTTDIDSSIELQKNIIKELLKLIKELKQKAINLRLIVLTSNAIAELAVDELNISNSPLIGFCKTLGLELPQFQTTLIDLDPADALSHAKQVVNEIHHNRDKHYEPMIAWRQGSRMVSRLKSIPLSDKKQILSGNGRYLITGGCGGLGLITAQALLSAGAKELILIARTINKSTIKDTIEKIQTEYPGRTIQTISVDVTDKACLGKLIADLNADGLLKGIIHAAGAAIKAPLIEHSAADVDYLFSAKVKGAWYLHELSQSCELDFFVVYSSISSVFGSNKESVYSATNSFLDVLIAERQRLGLVGTAIQWGPWGDVGMANKRSHDQGVKNALISNEQGHAFIKVLMNGQRSHATIISPEFLNFMVDFVPKPLPAFYQALVDDLGLDDRGYANPSINKDLSPWLSHYIELDVEQRFKACKQMLSAICKEILELPITQDLDDDEGFFEIGFDSLMIAEMASELRKKVAPALKVLVNIGFDYPSINKLSKYIESELDIQVIKKQKGFLPLKEEPESIAIIGMSCTLPNAPDIAAFEALLEHGLSGIKDIPSDRWDNSNYYDPNPGAPGKSYVTKMGLIENIKNFDAAFFGISPREAKFMEPQQRIFLENCYTALENANYPPESLRGSLTGVFAGVGPNEYYAQLRKSGFFYEELSAYTITGNVSNLIPGRVAYFFDFKGPSLSIDTACSSSLVALHYACQSLKNHEIDYALAGGVNILLMPESNITLCKAKALASDGQCKTFDEKADGYARAEGCGVVFLKRLSDAIRDKDSILAVIKASAVNNDGKSAGLTVPNGISQEAVMRKALSQTDISSDGIGYIEAHGTGTPLGDPIEVHAINKVYGPARSKDNPLYLGTVKTNIGHLESGSGITGIIKTVISLQKSKIYKNLNFQQLNPNIELNDTHIPVQNIDWINGAKLKCAGVNAFGFSGTNAHVILQQFPQQANSSASRAANRYLLVLSAKSSTALDALAKAYQQYLASTMDDWGDICFTASTCRDHYVYRLAVAATNNAEAASLLGLGQIALSHGNSNELDLHDNADLHLLFLKYLKGDSVDWLSYYKSHAEAFKKATLPNYPFDRIEFWPEKKKEPHSNLKLYDNAGLMIGDTEDLRLRKVTPNQFISYEFSLQHLYYTHWGVVNQTVPNHQEIPELLVITNDPVKAKIRLGNLSYQLINDISTLGEPGHKNILFFYEQGLFNNLFHCFQTLFHTHPNRFILVTENAYAMNDNDLVNPYQTMAGAFWKSFRNELNLSKNYSIDCDTTSVLVDTLNFIFNTDSPETEYAIRDSIYVPRLKKKQPALNFVQEKSLFDSNASYLITGGTGGLAEHLIQYLMRRGVKSIVLTSRSEPPKTTKTLIEQAAKKQIQIQHYQVDASNYQQMEHLLRDINQEVKPLKGVFHLAGVIQDGLIVNLTEERIQRVVSAKMDSALILHQLTQNMHLDLFVMFSSSASLLGATGQANYAAANGFLDGLAHLRHHQGLPALSINWGPFQNAGMTSNLSKSMQQHGFMLLDKDDLDILDVILCNDLTQIAVCPINWDLYFKSAPKQIGLSNFVKKTTASAPHFLNSLKNITKEECIAKLSQALCHITADVLFLDNIEKITPKDNLFSMGMDSLMFLEIRSRIYDKLHCPTLSLPIEYFINFPTIEKIATHIADELQQISPHETTSSFPAVVGEKKIPLCDFQYIFWVLNKNAFTFNIGTQLQLHGHLNIDYVAQAFDVVVKRNSAFWIKFDNKEPTQTLEKSGQFKLIYHDVSLNNEQDVLHQEFYRNLMRITSLSEQPLIRVYLYKINNDLHELHLLMPHIIADDVSCAIMLSQFKKSYEDISLGKKLTLTPEKESFLNYVKNNNYHYENDLDTKIRFWENYNKGFELLSFGPQNHLPDSAQYRTQHLFHYPLASQDMEQFVAWHKKNNINVSTGLIAACQIAFYRISHQKNIPVILISSGREGSQYDDIVGLFSEYKRINLTFNEEHAFVDSILSIEEQLMKTAPYQKCSHFIKDSGLKSIKLSISQYVPFILNKLLLTNSFKKSRLHSLIINYYLRYFTKIRSMKGGVLIKQKLNKLFKMDIPLQKPDRLRVLISITPSLFTKEVQEKSFANLTYSFPKHYSSVDRPTGNKTVWIYFSKNQYGEHQFSINGPLTKTCKDQLALEVNQIISQQTEVG